MVDKPKTKPYVAESIMNAKDFSKWASGAALGDSIIYHRGMLSNDRYIWPFNHASTDIIERIDMVGKAALLLESAGHIELFQRKHGMQDYEYLAYKRQAGSGAMPISELVK